MLAHRHPERSSPGPLLVALAGALGACAPDGPAGGHTGDSVPDSADTSDTADTADTADSGDTAPPFTGPYNVLLVIGDDIGIDRTPAYGEHPQPAPMPNVSELASNGVLFRNAWANPSCSATRASLFTGRYPTRTGIGMWIHAETDDAQLEPDELTIPEMLRHAATPYTSALAGKWHLAAFTRGAGPTDPLTQGFAHHRGSLGNPLDSVQSDHEATGYWDWERNDDGVVAWNTTYMVTDTTDSALALQAELPEPWLLVTAYNGAHTPLHVPPDELHTVDVTDDSEPPDLFDAMSVAVDTELGRLLAGIPPDVLARTVVIYLADNGSPENVVRAPWDPARSKATVYEGGINVPFIVSGPIVAEPGRESAALLHVVDLFPTFAELAGVDVGTLTVEEGEHVGAPVHLDGVSFLDVLTDPEAPGARDLVYSENFDPNGDGPRTTHGRAMRDADWKLIRQQDADGAVTEEYFRMEPGAFDEGRALSDDELDEAGAAAKLRLQTEMDALAAKLDADD